MKVQQISIFIENKSGRLAEVARVLGEKNVNIRALSLADTSDFGILRLLPLRCRIDRAGSVQFSRFSTKPKSTSSTCTPSSSATRAMP